VNRLVLTEFSVSNLKIFGYAWGLDHLPRWKEVLPDSRPSELPEFSVQVFSLNLWRSLFSWKLIQWRARLLTS